MMGSALSILNFLQPVTGDAELNFCSPHRQQLLKMLPGSIKIVAP
jgi:hypothetical protein